MIKRIKYWWFLRHNGYPHREEASAIYFDPRTRLTPRISQAIVRYHIGFTLEEIANQMGVTRERIRQMLLKAKRIHDVARNLRPSSQVSLLQDDDQRD